MQALSTSATTIYQPGVDLEDVHTSRFVGVGELDLPVYSPRSQQSRVQDIYAVGGHEHLDLVGGLKAVELVEQLEHGSLDLAVTAAARVLRPRRSDRVDLIHEDD